MNKYICRIVNMFLPVALVNLAAFFCAVDACWRLLLYSVNLYYSRTGFGKGIFGYSLPDSYGIVLLAYAFFAFAAFIFSARVLGKRGKLYFLFSLFFQGFAFIFILTKNIIYWKMGLWDFSQIFVNVFFGIQVFLVSYVGLAILFGIFSIKMVQRTLEIINQQLLSLEKF